MIDLNNVRMLGCADPKAPSKETFLKREQNNRDYNKLAYLHHAVLLLCGDERPLAVPLILSGQGWKIQYSAAGLFPEPLSPRGEIFRDDSRCATGRRLGFHKPSSVLLYVHCVICVGAACDLTGHITNDSLRAM